MDYREYEVPPALRRHVQCVWRLRDPHPAAVPQVIYPDGRVEIIVHLGVPMKRLRPGGEWQAQSAGLFAAQQRAPIRLVAAGPVDCFGVRLQPAASAAIPGGGLAALRDDIVDLSDVDAGFSAALALAVHRFVGGSEPTALWELMASRLLPCRLDERIEAAVAQLDAAHGNRRVLALAQGAAMSLRGFQGHFLGAVGLAAKEYARVLRLQAALRLLDAGKAGLAGVAIESGFADQAHATRDLQQLTGLTPARLSKALREQRDGEPALRLAAAFVRGYG